MSPLERLTALRSQILAIKNNSKRSRQMKALAKSVRRARLEAEIRHNNNRRSTVTKPQP